MTETANIHGTDGGSITLALPADFSLYHARRDLMAALRAESDPVKRERINVLRGMLESYDRAVSELQKASLVDAIRRQVELMAAF